MITKMRPYIAWVFIALACAAANAEEAFSPYVSEQGNISLPKNFRANMAHLGSWFVPEGEASGFHDVYMDRKSLEAYRSSGEFPDGAVLVKELRATNSGNYTTGKDVAYSTEQVKQWFVMIKDRKGRFTDNPLWGDGWGWALFKPDADASTVNIAADYKQDCLGCHVPARSNDWVYKEAYQTLQQPHP